MSGCWMRRSRRGRADDAPARGGAPCRRPRGVPLRLRRLRAPRDRLPGGRAPPARRGPRGTALAGGVPALAGLRRAPPADDGHDPLAAAAGAGGVPASAGAAGARLGTGGVAVAAGRGRGWTVSVALIDQVVTLAAELGGHDGSAVGRRR